MCKVIVDKGKREQYVANFVGLLAPDDTDGMTNRDSAVVLPTDGRFGLYLQVVHSSRVTLVSDELS